MGNLKALTDSNEYEVTSNETWEHGRIYFLKSDQDEGDELSVTVTFNDKEKYSDTNGVVDLNLPKVTETNGEFLYTFPSDLIESFGGATPTPILQFDSQYDNIPWLTTTAKFFVANDSENDYSTLLLENTSFNFDQYPFKDNIPSKNSYPSFYVYILRDSFDGNLMDVYSQGTEDAYSGSNSLGYFYTYENGEKQTSSAFSSNSGPGLAYVADELVVGRTASFPTNTDIIADDTYGYSNFEDWLGADTKIKVGVLGLDYDPSAGMDVLLAEYFIQCTIEYEPTPTPIPPLPDLNTWLSFDSQKFYTDANVSGQPPYRLVLENVTITESAIPSKIKTAISQGKLRLVSYPIRSTYTGSPFTPIGSDSAGDIYQPDIFFSYNGQSNQVGDGGVITNLSYSDTIRLGDFWNFYSDFASGLTIGSASYSESGDNLDTWKGSDDVKLGFGIAIAHSDYDYEVLYNERFDLQIIQFLNATPTPTPVPPTPTPTLTPSIFSLDPKSSNWFNSIDYISDDTEWAINNSSGVNTFTEGEAYLGFLPNVEYAMVLSTSSYVKFTDSSKNSISGLTISPYMTGFSLDEAHGGVTGLIKVKFPSDTQDVFLVGVPSNDFIGTGTYPLFTKIS